MRAVDDAIQRALPRAAKAGIMEVKPEVQRRAPRDEGELLESIEDEAGDSGANSAEHTLKVGKFYARFVEYGHGGPRPAPAHPFFRPSVDMAEEAALAATKERILAASRAVTG